MKTRPLTPWLTLGPVRARLEFKLPDLWVGVFWTDNEAWLCVLPCFPIHFERKERI